MKRLAYIIEIVFVVASFAAQAQHQYYYRVGDTIRGRDTIYHYQWWSEQWLSDPSHRLMLSERNVDHLTSFFFHYDYVPLCFGINTGHGIVLRYCYTEQPLKIVGIASSCTAAPLFWYAYDNPSLLNEAPQFTEYFEIYDADTGRNSFPRIAQVPFDHTVPLRYMQVAVRNKWQDGFCCSSPMIADTIYVPIREFYFDKPVTVYDSFYVGHTTNSNMYPSLGCGDHIIHQDSNRFMSWNLGYDPQALCNTSDTACDRPGPHLYKYRYFIYDYLYDIQTPYDTIYPCDTNWVDSRWRWASTHFFMLDFPIVEIDSSFYDGPPQYECPAVENLHIGHQEAGSVVLLWSSHPNQLRWEVSYGPQGTPPDSGTVQIAAIPAIMIAGLDSSTHYSAYIRAVCMHDSLVYSDWSEPLDICICDTGGTSAIETPLLEQLTYLMPNPATWQVQVLSSYGMTRVEAYNLQGKRMADVNVKGLGTILDVSDWPAGMYVVVIHTPAGNATKKLVVKR